MGLDHQLGSLAGGFFAIVLLNASLIGAGALTLSTSYAFGDLIGTKSSLHRSFSEAKGFYALFTLMVVCAAGIVLIPNLPLIRITVWVEAFNAFVLPIVLGFLVVMANDKKILGDRVNSRLGNVVAVGVGVICVGLGLWMGTLTILGRAG